MSGWGRWLRLLGLAGVLLMAALAWAYMQFTSFQQTPLSLPAQGLVYELKPGTSVHRLGQDLQAQGVLSHGRMLALLARYQGRSGKIRAGEYRIPPGTTPDSLLSLLVSGKTLQHSFTVVEGWTFRELMTALHAHPVLKATLEGLDDAEIMRRLGHAEEHPEGRFFAETYHFPRGTSDLDLLRRAYATTELHLAAAWAERDNDLPLKTPYEALILASIIEKETGLAEERPRIAGVFIRRLQRGMRLQTDPTVIYGLGADFDGNLRRRDLRTDTPYNTYTRHGLPPTPIAMPGAEALHAALHPQDGDALYFVARGDGSHEFTATLAAHERAVTRYQLGGRRRNKAQ